MSDDNTSYAIVVNQLPALQHCPDKTILEVMEANQIDVHYHCRQGFCGACRTKLLEGSVRYTTDPLAFIDDDEVLPCCCVPTSNITLQTC